MKSKAALGTHPIHPLLVTLPVGHSPWCYWAISEVSSPTIHFGTDFIDCLAVGILSALVAASVGLIDYSPSQ